MTYADALTWLGESRRFGMKLGLDPMRQLAAALGRPQDGLRFIHLAGTNGKGSTAAFCESCLRAAGHRVGLYTSPHLVSVRERLQIDRQPISEADFAEGMAVVRDAIKSTSEQASTFFEIMTGLALWYFARERVDWVVWETGLGGRLDATNIVDPEICIITNIGLDHQQYLGQSLTEIAAEKAGIIKPGVPVISAVETGEALEVISRRAQSEEGRLTLIPQEMEVVDLGMSGGRQKARIGGNEFTLGLIGPHQVVNAACAVAALRQLPSLSISSGDIARGLQTTVWPGRFEILSESPLIVLDGAHNPAGTARLVETWRAFLASQGEAKLASHTRVIFASVADKDVSEMARLLRPLAHEISFVSLDNERGAEPAAMASSFPGVPHSFHSSVAAVWADLPNPRDGSPTLITGSLFLVGEVLAHLQGNTEEYRLNERLDPALKR